MNQDISIFSKIIKLFWPDEIFERFVEWDKKITEKTGLQNPVGWNFTKNEILSPTTRYSADDVSGIKVTDIDWKRVIADYIRNPHSHDYEVKTYSANYTGLPTRAFFENVGWFTKQDKEKMMEYEPPYGIQFFFRNSGNIYSGDYDICCLIATIGLKESPNSFQDMPVIPPRLMNICVIFTYCLHKDSLNSIINDEQRYTKDIMAFLDKYCKYEKTRDDVLVEDRLLGERFREHHGY